MSSNEDGLQRQGYVYRDGAMSPNGGLQRQGYVYKDRAMFTETVLCHLMIV